MDSGPKLRNLVLTIPDSSREKLSSGAMVSTWRRRVTGSRSGHVRLANEAYVLESPRKKAETLGTVNVTPCRIIGIGVI